MSIVIPAHNQAPGIGRLLTALLDHASPTKFKIIVVCNGCADDTADVARESGSTVKVIKVPVVSKIFTLHV